MDRLRFCLWLILIILLLFFRSQASLPNPNMEGNQEMSGGHDPMRVHGDKFHAALNKGPVPPSAPFACTGENNKMRVMSTGKCPAGA